MLGHIEIGYVASTASRAVRIRIGAQVLARTSHGPAGSTSEAYGLKWFAAAKDAGFLDVALRCARDCAAEPATLVRAARDCCQGAEIRGADWGDRFGARARR